jgi:hypothetical protein
MGSSAAIEGLPWTGPAVRCEKPVTTVSRPACITCKVQVISSWTPGKQTRGWAPGLSVTASYSIVQERPCCSAGRPGARRRRSDGSRHDSKTDSTPSRCIMPASTRGPQSLPLVEETSRLRRPGNHFPMPRSSPAHNCNDGAMSGSSTTTSDVVPRVHFLDHRCRCTCGCLNARCASSP